MLDAEVRYRRHVTAPSLPSQSHVLDAEACAMAHKDVSLFRNCRRGSACPLQTSRRVCVCGAVSAVQPPREGSAPPPDRTLRSILLRSIMTVGTVAARPLGAAARLPARDAARQRHRVDVRSTDRSNDRSRSGAERSAATDRLRRSRFGDERSSPRLDPRAARRRSPREGERNAMMQWNVMRCVM